MFAEAEKPTYEMMAESIKVAAHPLRLRMLELLAENGPKTVSAIRDELGESRANLYTHLMKMRQVNLVSVERKGVYKFFQVEQEKMRHILDLFQGFAS